MIRSTGMMLSLSHHHHQYDGFMMTFDDASINGVIAFEGVGIIYHC